MRTPSDERVLHWANGQIRPCDFGAVIFSIRNADTAPVQGTISRRLVIDRRALYAAGKRMIKDRMPFKNLPRGYLLRGSKGSV